MRQPSSFRRSCLESPQYPAAPKTNTEKRSTPGEAGPLIARSTEVAIEIIKVGTLPVRMRRFIAGIAAGSMR